MKRIFDLNEAENVLTKSGYNTLLDSDEYGANIDINHNGKLIHVIDFRDLNDGLYSYEIKKLGELAIERENQPKNTGTITIEVEDLNKYF